VTTITTEESTIIPITFRGKEVTTTLVESSTKVITATEFSTETVVKNVPVAPTPSAPLPPIAQTAAPLASPQIAELLPALLGAQQANILTQQQQQEAARLQQQQEIKELLLQQQQDALLAQQFQEEFEQFQLEESLSEVQQEFLNEQLLAKLNLDDFTDEELANLDIDAVVDAVTNSQSQSNPLIFPKRNLFGTSPISAPKIEADSPKSSVITIFKSGSTPGDFTRVFSTVYFDDKKRRRRETSENDINPSLPVFVTRTDVVEAASGASDLDSGRYILGGPRGPVSADIWDLSDLYIQSGILLETETQPADHVIPTKSLHP
jgi:DNA primase